MTDKIPSSITQLFQTKENIIERLQQIKDEPGFVQGCAIQTSVIDGKVWIMEIKEVILDGVLWTIACPADRSMYLAITSEIGADQSRIVSRQYVPKNQVREPTLSTDARWWYIPLDGYSPDAKNENNTYKDWSDNIDTFYDLLFLLTCSSPELDRTDRVVLVRTQVDGLTYMGGTYNRKDGEIQPRQPERFKKILNTPSPFDDLEPGYYWLSGECKPNSVVYVDLRKARDENSSDDLMVYYTANISQRGHHVSEIDPKSTFTLIAHSSR